MSAHIILIKREIKEMSRIISKLSIASLLFSILAIFGCSSSDDSGAALPAVPSGAVTITDANAKLAIQNAISGGTTLINVLPVGVAVEQAPSARDIIDLVIDKTKTLQGSLLQNIPTGVLIDPPIQCSGGGTITGDATESETSASGTITFNNCIESGITINGTITFSASRNLVTGAWSLTINGNLSGTQSVETVTLSGLSYNETGNDFTGEFSLNTYTLAIDFTSGGGYLVQLLAAIVGNELEVCPATPRSGIIQVTGANNTRAKGTINSDGTVTIEFDDGSGAFTEVTGSPFPCSDFF